MGYTHYFVNDSHQKLSPEAFNLFSAECKRLHDAAAKQGIKVCRERNDESTPAIFNGNEVRFNGVGEDGHETFLITREWGDSFNFCKTAVKPYDLLVSACLISLKKHFPFICVSSDGTNEEWIDARNFCQKELEYGVDFLLDNER